MYENIKSEINVKKFAKNLAYSDDIRQSNFINKLAYALKVVCTDSDSLSIQVCAISDKLDKNGVDFINSLAEFIKLREDNKPKNNIK